MKLLKTTFLRLANILNHFEKNNVWKVVKEVRSKFLTDNLEPECNIVNTLVSEDSIKDNMEIVMSKLNLEIMTCYPIENLTLENIYDAADMFIYLNYCPSKLLPLFHHLFMTQSPKNILLAMTNIFKTSQNAEKDISIKIFKNMMKHFNLSNFENLELLVDENTIISLKNFTEEESWDKLGFKTSH